MCKFLETFPPQSRQSVATVHGSEAVFMAPVFVSVSAMLTRKVFGGSGNGYEAENEADTDCRIVIMVGISCQGNCSENNESENAVKHSAGVLSS